MLFLCKLFSIIYTQFHKFNILYLIIDLVLLSSKYNTNIFIESHLMHFG